MPYSCDKQSVVTKKEKEFKIINSSLVVCPVPAFIILRGHTGYFLEYLAEIIGILKSQLVSDFIDQVLTRIDQLFGMFNFHLGNII